MGQTLTAAVLSREGNVLILKIETLLGHTFDYNSSELIISSRKRIYNDVE